jgi:heparinase II/III-like protein
MPRPLNGLREQLTLADFHIMGGRADDGADHGRFKPRADLPAVELDLPVDWDMDPFRDRNWRFQLSAWRMLDPIWKKYSTQPAADLFAHALDSARDWHRYHVVEGRRSEFAWNDMATGLRAQHLAWMLHEGPAMGLMPSGDDARLLEAMADAHYHKLKQPGFVSLGNHGIFQAHGMRLLELVVDGLATPEQVAATDYTMAAIMDAQFDEAGVHREGAPFYHFFAERRLRKARPSLYPGIADRLREKLALARAVTPWFVMPDGRFCAVGDSEGTYPAKVKLPASASCGFTSRGVEVFARAMLDSGYACIRSGTSAAPETAFMLFISGTALGGKAHDHADALGFELYVGGRPMIVDAGKYGYENDGWRRFVISDRAHNTMGRESRVYVPTDSPDVGSCLRTYELAGNTHVIQGSVTRGPRFRTTRHFAFLPMEHLVITDEVEGLEEGERAELRFHFHEDCELDLQGPTLGIRHAGSLVAEMALPERVESATLHRGESAPRLGWRSPSYRTMVPIHSLVVRLSPGATSATTRLDFA